MEQQGKTLILEAARQQIVEDGLDSLSVRSVAKRAHYSPAGLYRHFSSIEQLRGDLTRQVAEEFRQMLVTRFTAEPQSDTTAIARYTTDWAAEQGNLAELLLTQPAENFWPEEFQVAWMDRFESLRSVCAERRRVICIVGWDALRSIVLVRSLNPDLDHGKFFSDYVDFLTKQIADGTL